MHSHIQSRILILGNGGPKSTAKYQEDANLNKCVETLQKIDIELKLREKKKVIDILEQKGLSQKQFAAMVVRRKLRLAAGSPISTAL